MKRFFLLIGIAAGSIPAAQAQETILLHNSGNVIYHTGVSNVDSIKFDNGLADFHQPVYGKLQLPVSSLDSLSFNDSADVPGAIYIIYNDTSVMIISPYAT